MFPNQQQMPRQGKSPLNEGLALLIEQQRINEALKKLAQMGQVSPVGPDGKPTIAGQAMQPQGPQGGPPGMPPQGGPQGPGVQDAMQQAATGAQMQMAQMQGGGGGMPPQGPPPGMPPQGPPSPMDQGIASVSGDVQMAEGGIVGYAGGPQDGSLVQYNPSGSAIGSSSGPRLLPDTTGYEGMSLPDFFGALWEDISNKLPSAEKENAKRNFQLRQEALQKQNAAREAELGPLNAPYRTEGRNLSEGERDFRYQQMLDKWDAEQKQKEEQKANEPDKAAQFDALLKTIGGSSVGAAPNLQRQLGSLINVGPAPQRPAATDYTAANAMFKKAQATRQGMQAPAGLEEAMPTLAKQDAARRAYYESQGIDPDFLKSENERLKQSAQKRVGELEGQVQRIDANKQSDALLSFLLGAKGRSVGELFGSGAVSSIGTQKSLEQKQEELRKSIFEVQQAAADKTRALELARIANAEGRMKEAIDYTNKAREFANNEKIAQAAVELRQAEVIGTRAEKATDVSKDLYSTDVTARTAAQNRAVQAALEQARLGQQAELERMRMGVQVQLEKFKLESKEDANTARLMTAINGDPIIKMFNSVGPELIKSFSPADKAKYAELVQAAAARIDMYREKSKLPAIGGTPIAGPATYKYDNQGKEVSTGK